VRPGESALARWAMTCSDGGRFSGEPASAVSGDASRCRAGDLGSFLEAGLVRAPALVLGWATRSPRLRRAIGRVDRPATGRP
jgi:hypothetical protein